MQRHPLLPKLLACGLGLLASASAMAQLTIILDMDPTTPPGPGPVPGPLFGPAGPATGFESGISVPSGSSVTVVAYVVQLDLSLPAGAPVPFDSIGLDLSWGLAGDTAALLPTTPALAGGLSAFTSAGLSEDYAIGTFPSSVPVGPGAALAPPPLPPLFGYSSSIGGAGFADISLPGVPAPLGQFGGFGAGAGGPGSYFDVFGVTFTATGSPGDSVTVTPSGIFAPTTAPTPGVPGLISAGLAPLMGGDAVYDSVAGSTESGFGLPTTYVGGTITIVPEPHEYALMGGLGLLGFAAWRRRRRQG